VNLIRESLTLNKNLSVIGFFLIVILFANPVIAVEVYQPSLGARAASMGQIYTSVVNDSTSLWYNPAGIARHEAAAAEFSVNYSYNRIEDPANEWQHLSNEINYVGGYSRLTDLRTEKQHRSWKYLQNLSIGMAYMTPYEIRYDSTSARNLLDDTPIGRVRVKYRQISLGSGYSMHKKLAIGFNADYLFTHVECLENAPCVSQGPAGYGISAGLVAGPFDLAIFDFSMALAFRSPITLNYDAYFRDSLTQKFLDGMPGRPRVISFGTQSQFVILQQVATSVNFSVEEIHWVSPESDNVSFNNTVEPYRRAGMSFELTSLVVKKLGISLRGAVSRVISDSDIISGAWQVSAGGGIQAFYHHFIDISLERRRISSSDVSWSPWLVNLSYSFQY